MVSRLAKDGHRYVLNLWLIPLGFRTVGFDDRRVSDYRVSRSFREDIGQRSRSGIRFVIQDLLGPPVMSMREPGLLHRDDFLVIGDDCRAAFRCRI